MQLLSATDITALNALSNDTLLVKADPQRLTLRLLKVVALSNFKALAAAGRAGEGAKFDASTKTLTVELLVPSSLNMTKLGCNDGQPPVEGVWFNYQFFTMSAATLADAVAVYPFSNLDKLRKLVQRLGGAKAKTYTSTTEALKARKNKPAAAPRVNAPDDMDMPMWDPIRGEWYDQETETRRGGQMRNPAPSSRPNMNNYGHED